jgi:hypothetical protein
MKSLRDYLVTTILLLGLLSIYIPIRYDMSYPKELGPQFDNRIRPNFINILNNEQPEILLIGDSMLGAAVKDKVVAEQLDKKVYMSSLPGTASTIWYSMIKNNIVVADHKPEYVVIFFRDSMMTVPGYRVTGRYFDLVDEFASPDDTLLIERAYVNQMSPLEKFMEAYLPLYGARWKIRENIDSQIRYTVGSNILDCDEICMDYSMEFVFKQDNLDLTFLSEALNAADDYLYTDDVLDFEEQIDKSLLPEIIRLCRENNVQLIMSRMPVFRFEDEYLSPIGLEKYIEGLSIYLEMNNVPFLDFDQKDIKVDYFTDAIHLNEQGKVIFTEKLIEALQRAID